MFSLRRAVLSDVEDMAYVHATSWQQTYTGLLDNHIINKFDVENRKKMWTAFLQKETETQGAYVAFHLNKVVGIASWNETADQLELLTLYVLSEFQRQGVGRLLFKEVEKSTTDKKKRLVTWVLEGNESAFFYEKMGLNLVKREEKRLGNMPVQELMFSKEWDQA